MDSQDTKDSEDGWGEKLEEMLAALDDTRLESEGGTTDPDPVSASGDTRTPTQSSEPMSSWLAELRKDLELSEDETDGMTDSGQSIPKEGTTPRAATKEKEKATLTGGRDKGAGNGSSAIAQSTI